MYCILLHSVFNLNNSDGYISGASQKKNKNYQMFCFVFFMFYNTLVNDHHQIDRPVYIMN